MGPDVRDPREPEESNALPRSPASTPAPDPDQINLATSTTGLSREGALRELLDLSTSSNVSRAVERVRHEGIFEYFSDEEISRLCRSAKIVTISQGAELRTERKGIYVLTQGSVQCYLKDAAGAHHKLSGGGPGQVFGELSFLIDRSEMHEAAVYVEAKEPLEVVRFDPQLFLSLCNGSLGAMHFLLSEQVRRLSFMNQFASHAVQLAPSKEALESRTTSQRLADLFQEKVGTWRFVIGSFGTMIAYTTYNTIAKAVEIPHWDEYPYQFLNLVLSTASGYAVPILLISQNRIAQIEAAAARVVQTMLEAIKGDLGSIKSDMKALRHENAELKKQINELLELLKKKEL